MKNLLSEIRKMQKKLNDSAIKNGVNSNKTKEISSKVDELINEYYKSIETVQFPPWSNSDYHYKLAYNILKDITLMNKRFPTIEEWNKIAKERVLFSAASIQYISGLNWNYLRAKVEKELNLKIF